ncbi:MAG: hypothetical protein RLZZ628_3705 [Bacteroidota bacterium]|jgi:type IX secretion system PorP/SprF family membrane protein
MKKYGIFCVAILLKINAFAQDFVFSQMQPNAALLNPAWQANRSQPYQLSAQYRNQWSPVLGTAAYKTIAASADAMFQLRRGNYWGGGIQFYQDQAGKMDFTQTQATISGFYSKFMMTSYGGKSQLRHYLTLGATFGFRQYRVDESKLHWVEQFEPSGVFNAGWAAPIYLENNRKMVEEVHVGLLWHANNAEKEGFEVGLSLSHLTKPNLSMVAGGNVPLNRRFAIHGSAYHNLDKIQMKYHFAILQQGETRQTVLGLQISTPFKKPSLKLGSGLAFRKSQGVIGDAVIATLNLDFQDYTILMSYDWNIAWSEIKRWNHAIEMGFVYKIRN